MEVESGAMYVKGDRRFPGAYQATKNRKNELALKEIGASGGTPPAEGGPQSIEGQPDEQSRLVPRKKGYTVTPFILISFPFFVVALAESLDYFIELVLVGLF